MLRAWKKANWLPTYLCSTISPKTVKHDYLLTCNVSSSNSEINGVECLVDTGAVDRNYVSRELGEKIKGMGAQEHPCDIPAICGCNNSMCIPCQGIVDFDLKFLNELTMQTETISIRATIIDSSFDLIIGRKDIFRHDLMFKTYKQIFSDLGVSTDAMPTGTSLNSLDAETDSYPLTYGAHTVPVGKSLEPGTAHSTSARLLAMNRSEVKRQVVTKNQLLNWEQEDDLEIDDDDDWDPFTETAPQVAKATRYSESQRYRLQSIAYAANTTMSSVTFSTHNPPW